MYDCGARQCVRMTGTHTYTQDSRREVSIGLFLGYVCVCVYASMISFFIESPLFIPLLFIPCIFWPSFFVFVFDLSIFSFLSFLLFLLLQDFHTHIYFLFEIASYWKCLPPCVPFSIRGTKSDWNVSHFIF